MLSTGHLTSEHDDREPLHEALWPSALRLHETEVALVSEGQKPLLHVSTHVLDKVPEVQALESWALVADRAGHVTGLHVGDEPVHVAVLPETEQVRVVLDPLSHV